MKKFLYTFILSFMIISTTLYNYQCFGIYIWNNPEIIQPVSSSISEEYINDASNPLNLDCGSAILIEQHTGEILYSYNSHEKLAPASVTKLMSILLIMDSINSGKIAYDTPIPCSENAASMGGSQIWLDTTETLTVDEMLKAICVVSANDCVTAMAEYIGGSEENFVNMMNEKAKELGMNDTTFKNCHGIDEDGHVTSSYDIALMSKELLNKYPEITKYTTIYMDSLRDGKSSLVNTNKLVRNYNGCTGLKTGSTSLALYNLSASATRDNLSLISVVMKAPTSALRFNNSSKILDYGFTNYEYKSLTNKGDVITSTAIPKGTSPNLNIVVNEDLGTILPKGNSSNIDQIITLNDNISAPISAGDIVGKLEYSLNGEIIASCDLHAQSDIRKISLWNMVADIYYKWFSLLI